MDERLLRRARRAELGPEDEPGRNLLLETDRVAGFDQTRRERNTVPRAVRFSMQPGRETSVNSRDHSTPTQKKNRTAAALGAFKDHMRGAQVARVLAKIYFYRGGMRD